MRDPLLGRITFFPTFFKNLHSVEVVNESILNNGKLREYVDKQPGNFKCANFAATQSEINNSKVRICRAPAHLGKQQATLQTVLPNTFLSSSLHLLGYN